MTDDFPVHEEVDVYDGETIYKESDWWKAALMCSVGAQSSGLSLCVYLWHNEDGEWKRKNKYHASDSETWDKDKEVIDKLMNGGLDTGVNTPEESLPVSDYYTVSHSSTVFKTENWWKEIVSISEKGDYNPEPEEIVVYLWQDKNGEWKRSQKYSVEDPEGWETEKEAIERLLNDRSGEHQEQADTQSVSGDGDLDDMIDELKRHVRLD